MRVLHVFKTYRPDSFTGVERVIWQLAEGCARFGIESEVLSLSAEPDAHSRIVGLHYAHKARLLANVASTGISLDFIGLLRRLARRVDVVHYHFPWPMMDLAHLMVRPARPAIVTYHSDIVRQKRLETFYAPLRTAFLRRMTHIVATSPNYLRTSPVLASFAGKTSVIPIGLDPSEADEPSEALLARWRERVGDRFFLFVGALRYYKGLEFLLDAARSSGLPLVVVGEGELGTRLAAADLPNLRMVGPVDDADKAALLRLSTAFVFPSHLRSEAFGVALLEAAFEGKPMISCELGTGTSYVNIDGETGIVVPPRDGDALAAAMERLWTDEALCARFGEAARRRAHAHFTAAAMSRAYADLYRHVAAPPAAAA